METLLPGTEVIARGLRWEVVFAQPAGEQSLYRLRCVEGGPALQGRELDLLVPLETLTPASTPLDPDHPGRLQDWRVYHDAFLLEQRLGPDALLAAQPGRLRPAAYQLVPVLRALALPRPRLLLADDVGLGKTVEAGMILAELIARRLAHRVLIVSPAGPLMKQWRAEMRERFGLRFRVLDSDALKEIRCGNELGANPFDHEALALISVDFAKQDSVLQDLERTHYDLVVIDEAHHCVSLGDAGDRGDSQRRSLAETLARRTDGLLLLTATPHDGHDAHFASLLELLDPSLVDGRGQLRGRAWERHVVRRLKRHIRDAKGEAMFRERVVVPVGVDGSAARTPAFARFHSALLALVAPLLRHARAKKRYADVLAWVSVLKRSVSSALAAAITLKAIAERLDDVALGRDDDEARAQRVRTMRELARRAARYGTLSPEEQDDLAQLETEELAASLVRQFSEENSPLDEALAKVAQTITRARKEENRAARTRDALRAIAALADEAQADDPKVERAVAVIREIRAAEPRANVLVYTEYGDSMKALQQRLDAARAKGELTGAVIALSGDDGDGDRDKLTERFTRDDDLVLVSTDASAEGLNLHARCHHLLHLELPYNPNRLEQRNGRIDRFGQTRDPVIRYLYLQDTFEHRLLWRLWERYETQRKRLGFVPNTLGASFAGGDDGGLLAGITDDVHDAPVLTPVGEKDLLATDQSRPVYRDMLDEIDRVLQGVEKVAHQHTWMGEAGLQAATAHVDAAERARANGQRLGVIDLVQFVVNAVRADSADPVAPRELSPGRWDLLLPPAWHGGLDEVPGWSPDEGVLRLTTDVAATHDDQKRPLGYLGRAHPIVRRALDRVRHIQHGAKDVFVDRRVAVARGDDPTPAVIYTLLGRVQSRAGSAFERVLAVRFEHDGALRVLDDVAGWAHLADPDRALPPKDVWRTHFAHWADTAPASVLARARTHFESLVDAWKPSLETSLNTEREALDGWLAQRALDRCGRAETQLALIERERLPRWKTEPDPAVRLAAYAHDGTQPPSARAEARTVLEIHRRRREALARQGELAAPVVNLLGILLLLPVEARRGA